MNSTNRVVANAMAARNSVEVEVSLMYAGRVQHAMRDAARSVSGVRVTGTNTLSCPDEDAADEVVDILEQAGVPKREISLNAKRVARNAAPKGLTPTTKLRLKEDFSDEYGSYKKGSVFPMYAMGGINPRFGTMMVPGRGVTLQIPWEKLEVVNAVARNADRLEEKSFGNGDVKASMKDFGRDPIYEISVYTTGITSSVSFADKGKKCVAEARAVLSAVERKASALKQAIAWMEQNAKAW